MSWIETYSGRQIDLLNPDPDQFVLEDIMRALLNVPRFGGHTKQFYSVAMHSFNVAMLLPDKLKFQGLMHDATEAFIGDMPTPYKKLLPQYKEAEARLWQAIAERFGINPVLDPLVKQADGVALIHERDYLKPTKVVWTDHENVLRLPLGTFWWNNINLKPLVKLAEDYKQLQ